MNAKRTTQTSILTVLTLVALTLVVHGASRMMSGSDSSEAMPARHQFSGPDGQPVALEGRLDRSRVLQGSDGLVRMELVLTAREPRGTTIRRPTDFLVVLDRSGSMAGDKIEHARTAVARLIDELATDDRLALVAYESVAELAIPLTPARADAKAAWRSVVAEVQPGGGTNMSSGLDLALSLLTERQRRRPARILLISDGLANEGDSSLEGLTGRGTAAARQEITLSTVGVGADFDEFVMSALADAGSGNYYYLENTHQLASVLEGEFAASRETVATGVAVTVTARDGVEVVDAAGYPLERDGQSAKFFPGSLFAGQERRIWVSFAAPATHVGRRELAAFDVAYTADGERFTAGFGEPIHVACVEDPAHFFESVDEGTWERAVVEEDYGRLRQQVARYVKAGKKDEALAEIRAYREVNATLNETFQNDAVSRNLTEVDDLEQELEAAFEGDDQVGKQNRFSKSQQAAGWDQRRSGAKRGASSAGDSQ